MDLTGKVKFGTADDTKGLGTGKNDYACVQLDGFWTVSPFHRPSAPCWLTRSGATHRGATRETSSTAHSASASTNSPRALVNRTVVAREIHLNRDRQKSSPCS